MGPIPFDTILTTSSLTIGYKNRKQADIVILENVDLDIFRGEMICLIGPNGAGKSTLIRTLAGMQDALQGQVLINNIPLDARHYKQLSQLISVVLTDRTSPGNLTVFDIVSMGRYPHTNWFGSLLREDIKIIKEAIEMVGMQSFEDRYFQSLSDGEKQRVMIARALAQDCPLVLLDEPTAHLDLPNRVEIMKLLRKLARDTNKSILLSTHELDLALQTSDRIWLMANKNIFTGTPEDLVLNGEFEKAFLNQSFDFDKHSGTFKVVYDQSKKIQLIGDSVRSFWTKRALERHGYQVVESEQQDKVTVFDAHWDVIRNNKHATCHSIWELLISLL